MTEPGRRTALLVAGEPSGDRLGAALCRALGQTDPDLLVQGVGGPLMAAEGCQIVLPFDDLMVSGLFEVLAHLPRIRRILSGLQRRIASSDRPDVLVLIDYQDFNLRLARSAHRLGVPVLFYVSPQVWAWRPGRARTLARVVDRLAVIFPFEVAWYKGLDLDVQYVGHPLVEEVVDLPDRTVARRLLGVEGSSPAIGLFPGSRRHEIRYNLQTLLETASLLRSRHPQASFLIPLAPGLSPEALAPAFDRARMGVRVLDEPLSLVARACDAALTVAGTATLQTGLAGTPMVVLYRMSPLSHFVLRRMVKVAHIGLVNIAAGKRVVREFVQSEARPEALADEIARILDDVPYREQIVRGLEEMRGKMGGPGGSLKVAGMVSEMSKGRVRSRPSNL